MDAIEFYFDYRSPYAYLAQAQIRQFGVQIIYRPFDIRIVMEAVGNVPTSVICKPKNRYIQADLKRWAAHYGVPFERNPHILDIDPRRLLRATLLAADVGSGDDLVTALFSAMWGAPEPLQTCADIDKIMRRVGVREDLLETQLDEPIWDERLARATAEAADRGVFGAPCIFIGEDMFFGNDRLDFVRAHLALAA